MARISENSKRYRTKEQMAQDVTFILSAPVSYAAKYAVIHEVTWIWTEFFGKYHGCPYWSKAALSLPRKGISKVAIHEHLVPRKVVISKLMELKTPSYQEVFSILEKYLIGVVVKNEENVLLSGAGLAKDMPPEFFDSRSPHFDDPWVRYKDRIEWVFLGPKA